MKRMKVYLDYGATSYRKPEQVFAGMEDFFKSNNTNPGRGGYRMALDAGKMIFQTRLNLKTLFNVPIRDHVLFTKNVTESLNVAIKGLVRKGDHLLISSLEHNAVYRVAEHLQKQGIATYDIIPVDSEGRFHLEELKKRIRVNTRLCIINHASNVSGHVMPVKDIARLCKESNMLLVVDGAQTAGSIPVDFQDLGCDVFCFTGHKHLLGPMGVGGFLLRDECAREMDTLIDGGTGSLSSSPDMPDALPDRFEAGTLNAVGIAGLKGALEYLLQKDLNTIYEGEMALHQRLVEGLWEIPGIRFYGDMRGNKLPVVSFNIPGLDSGELAGILDFQYGIMTRSGLHCSPLAHKTFQSPEGSIRLSLGHYTTKEEIDYTVTTLQNLGAYK